MATITGTVTYKAASVAEFNQLLERAQWQTLEHPQSCRLVSSNKPTRTVIVTFTNHE